MVENLFIAIRLALLKPINHCKQEKWLPRISLKNLASPNLEAKFLCAKRRTQCLKMLAILPSDRRTGDLSKIAGQFQKVFREDCMTRSKRWVYIAFQWKVGDHCRATFSEDGLKYEAEILSIDHETGTCYVRYVSYGNEEEQDIKDLQKISVKSKSKEKESDVEVITQFSPLFCFHTCHISQCHCVLCEIKSHRSYLNLTKFSDNIQYKKKVPYFAVYNTHFFHSKNDFGSPVRVLYRNTKIWIFFYKLRQVAKTHYTPVFVTKTHR